ncbi:MotE family protein [Hansschlegelia sp. KR7-227]|uniref:MotE family protein n=1 Tax=Hansschlegelia sp. KR7-227 TaxID=3400914 RepID=UPI003C0DB9D3
MSAAVGAARLRLMPMVMIAAAALLALKTIGLATHSSYLFVQPAAAKSAEAPAGAEPRPADGAPALPDDHGTNEGFGEQPGGAAGVARRSAPADVGPAKPEPSDSERALLEALQKRRQQIEARAADVDLRENLLKAAEKRMEERLAELKRMEQAIAEADERRARDESAKLKELVKMYETMKVKEAARIFDKLESGVLLDVASRIKPAAMAAILGQMSPEVAQKLTVAMARRDTGAPKPETLAATELPKIEGRSTR